MSDARRQPHVSPAAERYLTELADELSARQTAQQPGTLREVRTYIDGSVLSLGRPATPLDFVRILDGLGTVDDVADQVQRGEFNPPTPLPPPEPVDNRPKSVLGGVSVIFGSAALAMFWVFLFGTTMAIMTIIVGFFALKSPRVNRRMAFIGMAMGTAAFLLSVTFILASMLTGPEKPATDAAADLSSWSVVHR